MGPLNALAVQIAASAALSSEETASEGFELAEEVSTINCKISRGGHQGPIAPLKGLIGINRGIL